MKTTRRLFLKLVPALAAILATSRASAKPWPPKGGKPKLQRGPLRYGIPLYLWPDELPVGRPEEFQIVGVTPLVLRIEGKEYIMRKDTNELLPIIRKSDRAIVIAKPMPLT